MPRYTLAEAQAECITLGSSLLLAAELMQPQNAEEDLGIGDDDGVSSEESDWDEEEDTEQEETFGGDEEDEIMLQAVGIYLLDYGDSLLGNGKRGPYFQFPKSKDYFECCLNANDRDFRYHFRMGREMFYRLVAMLEPNPIFHSTGPKPQRPVEYQLGAFLYRYGTLGSDAVGAAHKTGIGYGSVINYCRRVTRAIRELRDKYVGFLSEEEQQATMDRIKERSGFPRCVGSGDGSGIRFDEKPIWNGTEFMGRKEYFGTVVQITVDDTRRVTSYEIGWPAAVADSRVFKQSHFWIHRNQYLVNGRYIFVDKGYPSSPYTVRPFSKPELDEASDSDRRRMRRFNYLLSMIRIRVEHAFGALKGRFPSLRCMGMHLDVKEIYEVIEALIVLHNMCLYHGDKPESIRDIILRDPDLLRDNEGFDSVHINGEPSLPDHETEAWLKQEGFRVRRELLDIVCPLEQ